MKLNPTPLVQNFLNLSSLLVVGNVIRFFYLLVIARFLSPEAAGIYLYGIGLYLALIVFANFGLPVLLASRLKRRPGSARHLIAHSLALRLVTIGLAFLAGVLITVLFEPHNEIRLVVLVFLATLIVRSLASWVRECFIGLEDSAWIVRYEVGFRGGEAIVGTCLLAAGAGLNAIVILHFALWAAEALISLRRLRRHLGNNLSPGREWRLLRRLLPISFVFLLSMGLFNVFPQLGVILMKIIRADFGSIANFGIAVQFFTTFAIFPTAMGLAVMPAIGRLSRRNAVGEIADLTTVLKMALLLGALLAIFADPFAPVLIAALLGDGYRAGGNAFGTLTWALGPYSAALIAGQSLNALNARAKAASGGMIMVTAHILIFALMLPYGALHAAGWSLLIGALIGCAVNCWSLSSVLEIKGCRWWFAPLGISALTYLASDLVPLPAVLSAPALALMIVLSAWCLKIMRFADLAATLRRTGLAGPTTS